MITRLMALITGAASPVRENSTRSAIRDGLDTVSTKSERAVVNARSTAFRMSGEYDCERFFTHNDRKSVELDEAAFCSQRSMSPLSSSRSDATTEYASKKAITTLETVIKDPIDMIILSVGLNASRTILKNTNAIHHHRRIAYRSTRAIAMRSNRYYYGSRVCRE